MPSKRFTCLGGFTLLRSTAFVVPGGLPLAGPLAGAAAISVMDIT
jgi:hypothetical protein